MSYPTVIIYWRDTWADGHNRELEEIQELGYLDTVTYGFLVEETEDVFKVVQTVWLSDGEIVVTRNLFVIPKFAVERMVQMYEGTEVWKNANL